MHGDYTADERVNAWIIAQFQAQEGSPAGHRYDRDHWNHLLECPGAKVQSSEGSDGTYGCDTGCEYARLTATIVCEHGMDVDYEYGDFGDMANILYKIEAGWEE